MAFLQNFVGNTLFVDANPNIGNDATGKREDPARPFQTITAALAAASSGDIVLIRAGTYNETITIPTGVTVRGVAIGAVTIQKLAVTADTTLVTMGDNTRLEDVALKLTSAGHFNLTGVLFPGTTTETAKIRTYTLTVDNSGAGAGASNVYGIRSNGSGTPGRERSTSRAGTVTVLSAGTGVKRAVLVDTAAGNFYSRDTNYVCTGSGGSDYIAAEVNFAGAELGIDTAVLDGTTADFSQTAGMFVVGGVDAVHANANGKSFDTSRYSLDFVWADPGGLPPNVTRFLRPGTATVSISEIKLRLPRKAIVKTLHVRVATAPGVGKTTTVTLRKNGIDTALVVALTGTDVSMVDTANSVSFAAGDDISMKVVTDAGNATADIVCAVEVY